MEPPFPTNIQEFDSDDRISFSKLDNKFIAVRNDGSEFEFDSETKEWVPIDDGLDGPVGAREPGSSVVDDHDKKRKLEQEQSAEVWPQLRAYRSCLNFACTCYPFTHFFSGLLTSGFSSQSEKSKPARPPKKQKAPPPPKQNTAVYVTGLPLDATVPEVFELFSRKGGVIAEEIDSGAPRIKLYADAEGNFKGDALVVFFKPQSVEMAIMLLDDTDFRVTSTGTRDGRIRVQAADSSYKKVQYDDNGQAMGGTAGNGQQGEKRPQRNDRDRQKIIKKTQKLDAKLADWDDDDPYPAQIERESKWDKMVILRHMFTLQELEEDPAALLDIKEDIRDECATLGAVTSVVLYDLESEGIVRVKFHDAQSAQDCIRVMHGRHFDGRTVQASLATSGDKFRKSSKDEHDGDSD